MGERCRQEIPSASAVAAAARQTSSPVSVVRYFLTFTINRTVPMGDTYLYSTGTGYLVPLWVPGAVRYFPSIPSIPLNCLVLHETRIRDNNNTNNTIIKARVRN